MLLDNAVLEATEGAEDVCEVVLVDDHICLEDQSTIRFIWQKRKR